MPRTLGSAGFNLNNGISSYVSGRTNGELDPRFADYGRWQTVGSEATHPEFAPSDPRLGPQGYIDGFNVQIANDDGSINWDRVIDRSQVRDDPQYGSVTALANLRDPEQRGDQIFYALGAGLVAAPALAAALGGTAGSAGMAGDESAGLNMGGGNSSLGSMYGSSGAPPDSYWNMVADNGGVASDASSGMGLGDGGGLDPETWAGNGGMGVSQNGLGSWNALPWQDRLAGLAANPGSAFSSTGMPAQLASSGTSSNLLKDPRAVMQLANLVTGLGSSLGGHGDSGSDNGPTSLGSMGWKPPKHAGKYQPAKYDKSYGSPYSGWVEQYLASLRPLGGMYGHG
jgi:hypothetical protein